MQRKKLLALLIFSCQLIFIECSVASEDNDSVPSRTSSATLPEGYVIFPEDHAAYKIHTDKASWYEGRDRCIAEGARLAITDSSEKIAHINSLKRNWRLQWLHVGIYKSNTTNQWVRIDNDLPVTSIPWLEDNPDGAGSCAGISFGSHGLVDYNCDWGDEFYVCEIPV